MDLAVARILDANFNRAREALRVLEDFARLALDDALLAAAAKQLRHDLTTHVLALPVERIWPARDTPGDVGTKISTPNEADRASMAAVVQAAGKRLGEALRSLEEYGKTVSADWSGRIEQLRYAAYDLEKRIVAVADTRLGWGRVRLYVLITASICRQPWQEVVRSAAQGGADAFQLREKSLSDRELLARAEAFCSLCRELGVRSMINDRADVAAAAGADGVHVGQDDFTIAAARRVLGTTGIVGVSTHTLDEARSAADQSPDYIAVGPMFTTSVKPEYGVAGPELLTAASGRISLPVSAIGGINVENVGSLALDARSSVAVCTSVIAADDVKTAAARIRDQLPD